MGPAAEPRDLVAVLAAHVGSSPDLAVERLVFGTTEPAALAVVLDEACRRTLGRRPVGATFVSTSVGCTVGLVLADDEQVVLKAYQPRWPEAFLRAVVHAQGCLHDAGLPSARPLAGPFPCGRGLATVESHLPADGVRSGTPGAEEREASARGLARLVHAARPLAGDPSVAPLAAHPLREPEPSTLWGVPHSPLIDFGPTTGTPAAKRIDALAIAAKAARDGTGAAPVVVHTDWALRNLRLAAPRSGPGDRGLEVVAIFDHDSLALVEETTGVGQAAQTWSGTGTGRGASRPYPDAAEVRAFARTYEQARGRPFTPVEWRAIGGAALANLCYLARCELALADLGPSASAGRRALDLLDADGDHLLDLHLDA